MSTGFDQYKCDCTRTGFYGENCTIRKFLLGFLPLEWGHIQLPSCCMFVLWRVPTNFSLLLALSLSS